MSYRGLSGLEQKLKAMINFEDKFLVLRFGANRVSTWDLSIRIMETLQDLTPKPLELRA